MNIEKNYGVILGQRDSDWIGGTIPYSIDNLSGDWTQWLPLGEWQTIENLDLMACVTFSATSIIETILNHKLHTGQISDSTLQRMIDLGYIQRKP